MQLLRIHQLTEGMVLAKDVYDYSGRVLLFEGIELKNSFIARLKELDVYALYVQAKGDVSPFDKSIKPISREETLKAITDSIQDVTAAKSIDVGQIKEDILNLLQTITQHKTVCLCISEIQNYDSYTESHSFNVAVLSLVIGIKLGLSESELLDLGMGAIVHDIGKLYIQRKLLNKAGKLTNVDYTELKRHTQYGHDMLANVDGISQEVRDIILDHHERMNGSGYPRGLKRDEIGLFSKIVMVADAFDAMTSDRIYKKGVTPYEAVRVIKAMGGVLFDPDVVEAFLSTVVPYPAGSMVELSNGQIGVVTASDPDLTVRVIYDEQGYKVNEAKEFVLDEDTELKVIRIS